MNRRRQQIIHPHVFLSGKLLKYQTRLRATGDQAHPAQLPPLHPVAIPDYSEYADLYLLFDEFNRHKINNETAKADMVAAEILAGLESDKFRVT